MAESFTSIWLSRLAIFAMAVYLLIAWKAFALDRKSRANKLTISFSLVFAIWSIVASFWYSLDDPAQSYRLYKLFAWTWCVFPPILLHFALVVTSRHSIFNRINNRLKKIIIVLSYIPALFFSFALPIIAIGWPVWRGGYWMLGIRNDAVYSAFAGFYFIYSLVSIYIFTDASIRADNKREKKMFLLIGITILSAALLGFTTDTIFLLLGVDFPNMAIFWILALPAMMFFLVAEYKLLSTVPAAEALDILGSMADFVFYLDENNSLIWANRSTIKAFGQNSLFEISGMGLNEIIPSFSESDILVPESARYWFHEKASLGPLKIPVKLHVYNINEDTGKSTVVYAEDLRHEEDIKKAEQQLSELGILLDEFISRSMDGIILTNIDGVIIRINDSMETLTGLKSEDVLGMYYWDAHTIVMPAETRDRERVKDTVKNALRDTSSPWYTRLNDYPLVKLDGTEIIVQSDVFTIPYFNGMVLAVIARDITEQKQLEKERINRIRDQEHAQKLEAIGTLSGGIAHDFNNTLSGIIGAMSIIKSSLMENPQKAISGFTRELDIIEKSANRAGASVKRLLALSRKNRQETVSFRLDESIQRVLDFASLSLNNHILVEHGEFPEAWVSGDPGQIEQALLNLVLNAEQAMTIMLPDEKDWGGKIKISLELQKPGNLPGELNRDGAKYWAVSVSDQGPGIPPEIHKSIFNPFFTTKRMETSSGLGLSMAMNTAVQHKGNLTLVSEPGKGACFTLWLPETRNLDTAVEAELPKLDIRNMVALLADDEELPRESCKAMLEALGFTVDAFASAEDAVKAFAARPARWNLAILDIRMPKMNGEQAARLMRLSKTDLPVIFISGYHSTDIENRTKILDAEFLDKPFNIDDLKRAVYSLLG